MKQIFKNNRLIKKSNIKIIQKLKENNLDFSFIKYFIFFDDNNIIIKNFIYLLRLNKLDENKYIDSIVLIKLIWFFYHIDFITNKLILINKNNIWKIINILNKKIIKQKINNNYEIVIFSKYLNNYSQCNKYINFNKLYNNISNIFMQPFLNISNYLSYYKYSYLLIMLINLIIIKNKIKDKKNIEIFKIQLNIMFQYNYEIANITKIYFNYFIQKNNYFLKQYEIKK